MTRGVILAAPHSGSGKTTVTLGLLRALSARGVRVQGAKSGPDYIDPRFHAHSCGQPCVNLDAWAMGPKRLSALLHGADLVLIEGAMGLFDGAPPTGKGAVADLARLYGIPVILVVDVSRMAQSVAAIVAGFARHDPEVHIGGIILNKVGSPRHEAMLRAALAPLDIPVLGALHRNGDLSLPSRHLGLVQAEEREDLDVFLDRAGKIVGETVDLDAVAILANDITTLPAHPRTAPPAQTIAVAEDAAFAFSYPHLLADWRAQGAEVRLFSPLAGDTTPVADLIYLPGGYPELHAGRIANNHHFLQALREAAARRAVYGECGGFMVLGDGMVDGQGVRHKMAGLLRLETSFAQRKLSLGYRDAQVAGGPFHGRWKAHEFHYATTLKSEGQPFAASQDAEGSDLGPTGLRAGSVSGSFLHLIDRI
ncbi:cobyrinate a,c-diamide synthase [Celeribacter arenosi]|uniref:Hydrogenobyrinate a,c-diamide synthase n=1 Tax=Celeribacter arenosi TaxID=792649 RepID=A0ABP7KGZ5_9RHOB